MNEEDKDKWVRLFITMEQTNLMGFILTILENFNKTDLEQCYKEQLERLEFLNSVSKDLAKNGDKNMESWLFSAKVLESGVEI